MQKAITLGKIQTIIIAAVVAAIVALSMGLAGTQQAYAAQNKAVPSGSQVTVNGKWVVKNMHNISGYTLVGVKGKAKSAKSISVPDYVKYNGAETEIASVAKNAFKGSKATKVTLGKYVYTIKSKAFAKSKVKTLVLKTGKLTKAKIKNCLKGSKVTKVVLKGDAKKKFKNYKKWFTSKKVVGKKGVKVTK